MIGDALQNIRSEVSRHFRKKKRQYLNENIHKREERVRTGTLETFVEVSINRAVRRRDSHIL
jgi:hypothetical protein